MVGRDAADNIEVRVAAWESLIRQRRVRVPGGLQRLINAAGISAALRLVATAGGQEIYVPQEIVDGHELWRLLGPASRSLVDEYGGEPLRVPTGATLDRAVRRAQVIQMSRCGVAQNVIAQRVGISARQVQRITRHMTCGKIPPRPRH